MDTAAVFKFQAACSIVMFGIVAKWYVWPRLARMSQMDALIPLLVYSGFRYIGTFFMVPQITNGLTPEWGNPAAYLDIISVITALIAAFLLRAGNRLGIAAAWVYGIIGTFAFVHGGIYVESMQVPTTIGAAMPVMTILGPSWMVTLAVLFYTLLKHPQKSS